MKNNSTFITIIICFLFQQDWRKNEMKKGISNFKMPFIIFFFSPARIEIHTVMRVNTGTGME